MLQRTCVSVPHAEQLRDRWRHVLGSGCVTVALYARLEIIDVTAHSVYFRPTETSEIRLNAPIVSWVITSASAIIPKLTSEDAGLDLPFLLRIRAPPCKRRRLRRYVL